VENLRIDGTGEEWGDAQSTFFLAYILSFVIYFMVLFYGVSVMRSVLEEKTSRIAEVLVSSLRSTELMAGKIIGVASAALLQVFIWAALIGLLITQSDAIAERIGIDPESLTAVSLDPGTIALLLAYFLVGFLLFAALFAALGASVTTEQEAQSFQMVLVIPLVVPLGFLVPLTSEPLGRAATFLGLFPLTSPIAMPMRLSAAAIPPTQIALSLVFLASALLLTGWLAGRIYRIGILATGKRPSCRELIHWLRMS
jgi:ABC-2 type transport system permease protein